MIPDVWSMPLKASAEVPAMKSISKVIVLHSRITSYHYLTSWMCFGLYVLPSSQSPFLFARKSFKKLQDSYRTLARNARTFSFFLLRECIESENSRGKPRQEQMVRYGVGGILTDFKMLVAMPGAPSSVLAPSSDARSP